MSIKIIGLVLCLQLVACSEERNDLTYKGLNSYLDERGVSLSEKRSVLILNDKGCINCNHSFANLTQNYLDREDVVIINLEDGSKLDISVYLENKKVLNDFNNSLNQYIDLDYSAAIFIKDARIDTIVVIEAKTISNSMDYIKSQFDINSSE